MARALALALCGPLAARALLLGAPLARRAALDEVEMTEFKMMLGRKMMMRFAAVDEDGDGVVTLAEMRSSFAYEPAEQGEPILRSMLAECAGVPVERAERCTGHQMQAALSRWASSRDSSQALQLLQQDTQGGFAPVHKHGDGELCGPSIGEGRDDQAPVPDLRCSWQGARCWSSGKMLAWSLKEVCASRGCVCEPLNATKRLAKLGLAGALAVTTAKNFSDERDTVSVPACGDGWKARKINGHITQLSKQLDLMDKIMVNTGASLVLSNDTLQKAVREADDDDTEVALFSAERHQVARGGQPELVCMISWQATRSPGDWKTNFMAREIQFKYAPAGVNFRVAKGIALAYYSAREELKAAFEAECCSGGRRASRLVISGHSHGGAMAEVNAVDVVANWECPRGRDLGAPDLALVTLAPHASMLSMGVVNQVFSCSDPANCLAGSVVTLVTERDPVGEGTFQMHTIGAPKHPSVVSRLPCLAQPRSSQSDKKWWCHGIFNYVPALEQHKVDEEGWGSSCGGACGDLNRQVQCNQWVLYTDSGCAFARKNLSAPTACAADRWQAGKEKCDCHFDSCEYLTQLDCIS